MTGREGGTPKLHGGRILYCPLAAALILLMVSAVSIGAADLRPARVFQIGRAHV